ncbi:hypothetical protein CGH02_23905 [Vibrio parahaemolyticus]|uniref:hypothetical protein n=1 Tax=Vibrio parahaemolyticus TaxID=670 RepID=UPI00111F4B3C|nr:hypothetical protein [Vibrio parahaemolyticus]EIV8651628.1 hypothetical protein [Vibrio parahaemolyticus]EJE4735943.1 hypothetical protein [Vibrio parahaemolyticus]MDF4592797.1 hypothetical protein [Vibrio parahaemolyticus]TOH98565.1 hypothetical protein CGI69_22295 [Vibrio parahaemolyticus]TOJ33790.1 hypothetical protein CGI40_23755 [Vibrio parahaemolyticus]
MESHREELLALLSKECGEYSSIPESEQQQKRDKKSFINGLMTACRVVGISYDELNTIVEAMPKQAKFKDLDEQLAIPTYIRNKVEIQR